MRLRSQSGVTLIELLVVIVIASVIIGLSFPSLTSGLAGVRLASSSSAAASFLTASLNTVERHELAAAIVVSPKENRLEMFTAESGTKPAETYQLPAGIAFEGNEPRQYMLFPGGVFPRILLVLHNERGSRRSVQIDPVTGVPQIQRMEDAAR